MNRLGILALLTLGSLCAIAASAPQEPAGSDEENREAWTRKDDGKIRLATPRATKDGRVRGNLNVVADRVRATIETDDIEKLYTTSTPDELEVAIVLKSGKGADKLARSLLLELYDIVFDSDVRSCKLEFIHGEEWVEIRPREGNLPAVRERKPGPVIHQTIISASATEKSKDAG